MIPLGLILKLTVPPVLVALMSLAARRWGPTFGGLILGLPWMTGPVLFFLGLDNGPEFLVRAAKGTELAAWGFGAFLLAFAYTSGVARWLPSLLAGIAGYFAVAAVTQSLDISLGVAAAIAVLVLAVTAQLLPKPVTSATPGRLPAWDIPARMAATFTLVAFIVATVDLLGPQRSGLVASYPVILTVIATFTLRQWGRDAALRLFKGVALSLQAFVGFFFVVGMATPALGQVLSYLLAVAFGVSISAALLWYNRSRIRKQGALVRSG